MQLTRRRSAHAHLQVFVAFLSMVAFEAIVKPRVLAWVAKGMTELPIRTEADAESGSFVLSDLNRRDSVSSSLSISLSQSMRNFRNGILQALDSALILTRVERVKELSVVRERVTGDRMNFTQV